MPGHDRFAQTPLPRRRRRWWKIALIGVLLAVLLGGGGAAGTLWYFSQDLPSLDPLQNYQPSLVTRVYSEDRQVIGQFFIERRFLKPLQEMPKSLTQAVIATEDTRFFEHPGLDIVGILRAAWTNIRHGGRKVEGASTITQQLARSLFLSAERTFDRKLRELILAYKMELVLTKEQILEMYLNQIYFGQGAYGVAAAGQTYFGKELSQLTLAESAFLAGLPKSPSHYSPFKAYDRAKKRQEHVLGRMEEAGFITRADREQAVAEKLNFRRPGSEHLGPYFVEYIRQLLVAKFGETMVYKGGLEVFTTLNADMQKAAEAAVSNGLRELDKRQGWRGPVRTVDPATLEVSAPDPSVKLAEGDVMEGVVTKIQKDHVLVQIGGGTGRLAFDDMAWAAKRLKGKDPIKDVVLVKNLKQLLVPGDVIEVGIKKLEKEIVHLRLEQTPIAEGALIAIDPKTGAIRAMVGGYDFTRSEFNRAVLARRQPGSAFKPVIYATAMNQGMSPATVVLDAPVVYEQEEEDKTWKPENYGKRFHGIVSLREALIHSHNLATVRLLDKVGIRNVIDFARTVGIVSPLAADLSLALGSSSVSMMELVSVYGVFANQGLRVEPYAIASVQDSGGRMLDQASIQPRQVVSRETAYLITNMMEDVVQRGTGVAAKAAIDRPVAGKTGTTNDFTDAWFIGSAPNLAAGTWVGFDDRRPLGETESGAHAALPIWISFMKEALKQLPVVPFEIPDGVMYVKVDPATALLTDQDEQQGTVELFTRGTEPTKSAGSKIDPTDFYKLDHIPESAPPPTSEP
ncbi:MAG: PBP1A family penicillin-binding protein [Nitrospira sp.]|nr:PBP1A family penicillin-binding protein [Nitrospira sp.]MEB2340036.1 PBP1A family penicillin-binding protein [Nitrospirales bacterium]